jgi:methylase of polypeptide subunit release factors
VQFVLPHLGDLRRRLEEPGGRVLDVGTGVAAMAVAYAETFPAVHVVGLDVSERALNLAKDTVANSPAGSRVELRLQSVADLDDESAYDMAWLPAPFIPETALQQGIARIAIALRPGGWAMLGHGKYGSDRVDDAVNRFKTVAFGGTPLSDAEAEALLTEAGLSNVVHIPTPPGAPAIALAQRV